MYVGHNIVLQKKNKLEKLAFDVIRKTASIHLKLILHVFIKYKSVFSQLFIKINGDTFFVTEL